jgi:hypothetical protein
MNKNLSDEFFDLYELGIRKDENEYEKSFPYINISYSELSFLNEYSNTSTNNSDNRTEENENDEL